jgi:CubicO group peptidase (beta-lactamase class C family)
MIRAGLVAALASSSSLAASLVHASEPHTSELNTTENGLTSSGTNHPPSRADLEDWAWALMTNANTNGQFIGASIVIVTADGPLLVRGFGYADHENVDPIHPAITYLPIGALGNLFVAESLLEFERDQRLSMSDPAGGFLSRLSLPIEYRHLKVEDLFGGGTGLSPAMRGTLSKRKSGAPSDLQTLRLMLKRSLNEGVPPPGASPLAHALASLVLEDVAGEPSKALISERLRSEYGVHAFFNSIDAEQPKYTSHGHAISKYGHVTIEPFHASTQGFVAANGIFMTASDISQFLIKQMQARTFKDPEVENVTVKAQSLIFNPSRATDREGRVLRLSTHVASSTIEVVVIDEIGLAIYAMVNSNARFPDVEAGRGRTPLAPPLNASDITENFLARFLVSNVESPVALSLRGFDGLYVKTTASLAGPDRLLEILSPKIKVRTSRNQGLFVDGDGPYFEEQSSHEKGTPNIGGNGKSIRLYGAPDGSRSLTLSGETFTQTPRQTNLNSLTIIFLFSIVLQFALLASARWPVPTSGQRLAKWLGITSVLVMNMALFMPFGLLIAGHSPFVIDGLYRVSGLAFQIAVTMALFTFAVSAVAWRHSFWADDGFGTQRRLCFTVGSIGLVGLAFVTFQLNLGLPLGSIL